MYEILKFPSFLFYISYLFIPIAFFSIVYWHKKKKTLSRVKKFLLWVIIILSVAGVWARFIERNIIITRTTDIEVGFSAKIVVIADLHLGVYKNKAFLSRIVKKINKIDDVDAVLVPGDFTFYPPKDLRNLFEPLSELKVPVFAVLGNHDSERPGPPIQKELKEVLESLNVTFLHNSSSKIKNTNIKILGLGTLLANEDDVEKISNFSKSDNLIVMTHNPDTTMKYDNSIADLTVSGHTHGGQVRIPFIYKSFVPCKFPFDRGFYNLVPNPEKFGQSDGKNIIYTKNHFAKVFVTSGLGEIGLPLRLAIPPTIDILNLK